MKLLEATLNLVKEVGEPLFLDTSRSYAYTLLAKFQDNRKLLIRVAPESEQVSKSSLKDLKLLSHYTNTSALCIVSTVGRQILQRGVIHMRDNVTFMSLATFIDVLEGKKQYYKLSRGIITATIEGERLREKRERASVSLNALASELGVSRETVYRYERGDVEAPVRVTQKLISMFGEDVIKEVKIEDKPRITLEEIKSRQIDVNTYRLAESHPDALRADRKVLLISTDVKKFEKTVELANALGVEVERAWTTSRGEKIR